MNKKLNLQILKRISAIPTASFFEDSTRTECEKILQELFKKNKNISWKQDKYGNLVAHYQGDKNRTNPKCLAFVVHLDHPAFHIVKGKAKIMGGLNPHILPGTKIVLHGNSSKIGKGELGQGEKGLFDFVTKDQGKFIFATFDLPPLSIGKDKIIRAPVLDDLASVGMSITALKEVVGTNLNLDLYVVFHRAEEVGFIGAYGAASSNMMVKGTFVLSVETSSYKVSEEEIAQVGGGVILRTGDRLTPVYESACLRLLRETKKQFTGKIQEVCMNGGSCEAALYYALGYRAAGVCLPLIAWHNNGSLENKNKIIPEGAHLDDFNSGTKYLVEIAKTLSSKPELYSNLDQIKITSEQQKMVAAVKKSFAGYRKQGLI